MKTMERFGIFLEDATRLVETPYLQAAAKAGRFNRFELSWTMGGPTRLHSEGPSRDALDLILIRMRPFILKREATYVNGIYKLALRSIRSEELQTNLLAGRAAWLRAQTSSGLNLRLGINNRDMPPELAAELVLYGSGHFHRTRYDEWVALGGLGQALTREIFLMWLLDAIDAVEKVAAVVQIAIGQGLVEPGREDF